MQSQRKALFLDRDGVINVNTGYLHKPEDCIFIEGIFDLCRTAHSLDYALIIITNQAGIARGLYTEETYQDFTTWLQQRFEDEAIAFTGIYHCPHHPEYGEKVESHLRKPNPGMILQAAKEHCLSLAQSICIGDSATDMEAAFRANIPTRIYFNKAPMPAAATHRSESHQQSLSILQTLDHLK